MFRISGSSLLLGGCDDPEILRYENLKSVPQVLTSDMAIAAILPKDDRSEDRLVFTVVGLTVLQAVAMIINPVMSQVLGFDDVTAGIYIGATIHDVAQVVGSGFSISEEAGETATLVKLLRVAMLAPVVICTALLLRSVSDAAPDGKRSPFIPLFVLGFIILATLNSTVASPEALAVIAADASGWLLLIAIDAVGVKTRLADMMKDGGRRLRSWSAKRFSCRIGHCRIAYPTR